MRLRGAEAGLQRFHHLMDVRVRMVVDVRRCVRLGCGFGVGPVLRLPFVAHDFCRPRARIGPSARRSAPALVAQGIEHRSPKAGVGSSNLPEGTTTFRQATVHFLARRPWSPRGPGGSVAHICGTRAPSRSSPLPSALKLVSSVRSPKPCKSIATISRVRGSLDDGESSPRGIAALGVAQLWHYGVQAIAFLHAQPLAQASPNRLPPTLPRSTRVAWHPRDARRRRT